jgi:polysaccharide biosynthesis/export protein VpsN
MMQNTNFKKHSLWQLVRFFLFLMFLTACNSTSLIHEEYPKLPEAIHGSAVLFSGDELIIQLQGIPKDEQRDYKIKIDDEGNISLPLIGKIKAEGTTESALADLIVSTYLKKKYYTKISVSVSAPTRFIFVGGKVRRPGPVDFIDDMTLSKAIQAAGGFDLYAKKNPVIVVRNKTPWKVDGKIAEEGGYDPKLYPGDKITVLRKIY